MFKRIKLLAYYIVKSFSSFKRKPSLKISAIINAKSTKAKGVNDTSSQLNHPF